MQIRIVMYVDGEYNRQRSKMDCRICLMLDMIHGTKV